jgi:DNA-binding response OmpR family regulator
MVTAVEPNFDIIEMGFDAYLVKPVERATLSETIDDLLTRSTYESDVQELFSLSSKKAMLESQKSQSALAGNEEYQELSERIEELREELDTTMDSLDSHEDYTGFYQEFDDTDEQLSLE